MDTERTREQLRDAGFGAWRMTVLAASTALIVVLYLGMAFLVYRGEISEGPLVLFTGIILGYVLRSARALL